MNLQDYIDRLYRLKRDKSAGHERPHKPALLLAILDLIDSGAIKANRIELSDQLITKFKAVFATVAEKDDRPTIQNPFYYLSGDGFWHLQPSKGNQPLYVPGIVRAPKSVAQLRKEADYAYFDPDLWTLFQSRKIRNEVRSYLIARYFPDKATELARLGYEYGEKRDDTDGRTAESPLRSTAFRRIICELYDHQCAACGLRIRLENELSFVDAAHLIPFSASRNDHPSNGIALCKNHHWAMDHSLIALNHDDTWAIAPIINPRRSAGEQELSALDGHRIIRLPSEQDFRPAAAGRESRMHRLLQA
ncbi:MAG: HNH endonuclease [Opitutaceae bacterium]